MGQNPKANILREKKYEALLTDAVETADICLDMEGETLFMAWNGKLIQELVAAGCCRSAILWSKCYVRRLALNLRGRSMMGWSETRSRLG